MEAAEILFLLARVHTHESWFIFSSREEGANISVITEGKAATRSRSGNRIESRTNLGRVWINPLPLSRNDERTITKRASRANLRSEPAIRRATLDHFLTAGVIECRPVHTHRLPPGREKEEGVARILIHQTFQFCPPISSAQNRAPDISLSWPVTRSPSPEDRYACVKSLGGNTIKSRGKKH